LIPTIDFSEIKSILDKAKIQEIKPPLKTNSIEICIDGTYTELAGDFFKDFKLLLNPIGQEVSKGGDFCKITNAGLECGLLNLDVAGAKPVIDADTITEIKKLIDDIIGTLGGIPSGASNTFDDIGKDLDDLLDCIISGNNCAE